MRRNFTTQTQPVSRRSKRPWKELRTTRHAPDHHATFTEAEYLKAIYLMVE